MKIYILFAVFIVVILSIGTTACTEFPESDGLSLVAKSESGFSNFYIVHDDINNATIYLYSKDRACAMTVMPDWMLTPNNMTAASQYTISEAK